MNRIIKQITTVTALVLVFVALQTSVASASAQEQKKPVVRNADSQPRVVNTVPADIAELPRTGFPLIAWGIAALIPFGYKLRKTNKKDHDLDLSPQSVWMKRQLDK
jgi:hypothetical protein